MTAVALLLAEDDDFVRRSLARALDRTGTFTVLPAEDGRRAVAVLNSGQRVDAILTDLQMPGMDGVGLIAHVLQQRLRIPVAVMTGHPITPELRERLRRSGVAAIFTKPIDLGTFTDELQRALSPATVGHISGITTFGFLQLLEVEEKTGVIVARSNQREGRLYFERGAPVHAYTESREGAEALYEIVAWPTPRFEVFYGRTARQRTIDQPLRNLLMEAARLLDERGRAGPIEPLPEIPRPRGPGARAGAAPEAEPAVLEGAMAIEGALGAALGDSATGMILGSAGGTDMLDVELMAAAAADLLRAKLRALAAAGSGDVIEDVMITMSTQYHLLRFAGPEQELFLYLILDRQRANLALGRRRLAALAKTIAV